MERVDTSSVALNTSALLLLALGHIARAVGAAKVGRGASGTLLAGLVPSGEEGEGGR
ncbi:hypothetical protein T492DRAFT_875385 [Pavlovales sp. CCMP2436]|nr:hypothetical protein T492DRAFT_875385 [Pavlovales sp. CCMP2436]